MTIHRRAFSIHIDNPYSGTPSCTFQQERVVEVDGEIIKEPIGELKVDFDPADEKALQLYTLLRDYYIELITPPTVVEEPVEEIPPPEEETV